MDVESNANAHDACRVGRDEEFGIQPATTHLMNFWRRSIQNFWNKPGFEVRIRIVNLDEVPGVTLKAYEQKNIVWHIRMNHNKESRATYKAIMGKPHPIYAGIPKDTIVHEFGHAIGLDDEYPEGKNPPGYRDCQVLGGSSYVMCSLSFNTPQEMGKAVYSWIVTRRYLTGSRL